MEEEELLAKEAWDRFWAALSDPEPYDPNTEYEFEQENQ